VGAHLAAPRLRGGCGGGLATVQVRLPAPPPRCSLREGHQGTRVTSCLPAAPPALIVVKLFAAS
jgi:hypothetical protein